MKDECQSVKIWLQQSQDANGTLRLIVRGNSMSPLLRHSDAVDVLRTKIDALTCGDIIVRCSNDVVTHRFIASRKGKILTKGDSVPFFDRPAEPEEIVGIVSMIERNDNRTNMESPRWELVNKCIGALGKLQLLLFGLEHPMQQPCKFIHRAFYWFGKRLVWVILILLAGYWINVREVRMDKNGKSRSGG